MPTYKLYYFDFPARGELPRLILSAAGQAFEDIRFSEAEWPTYKAKMPFGQVPVLEVDDQMIAQEYAISKYLAREFGLCSPNNKDHAKEDVYAFLSEDLYKTVEPICFDEDKEKVAAMTKTFLAETGPSILASLESALSGSESGYLVGDKMSWADIAVFSNIGFMEYTLPKESATLLKSYPKVQKLQELVSSNPNIGAYLKKRAKP